VGSVEVEKWKGLMRYVLPALPVSGPSGNRARRREAARLAQRQGTARRSGKSTRAPAVATPQLPEIAKVGVKLQR
jgi:hypothetical protein